MGRTRRWAVVAAAAAGATILSLAPAQPVLADDIPKLDQVGTVRVDGCLVKPSDVLLTATPALVPKVTDHDPDDPIGDPDDGPSTPAGRIRNARVKATADPHVFTFQIRRLRADRPYTLDIRLKKNCGPVTWTGPTRGLIIPGQSNVTVRGIAVTTKIEIASVDPSGTTTFRASDFYTDDAPQRRFRWTSALGGTDVALQLSLDRFPEETESGTACATPPNTFINVRLHGRTGTNVTPALDVEQLVDYMGTKVGGGFTDGGATFSSPVGPTPSTGGAPEASVVSGTITPLLPAQRLAVHLGAPVFARVVPITAAGAIICDPTSSGAPSFATLVRKVGVGILDVPTDALFTAGTLQGAQPVDPHDVCVTSVRAHKVGTEPTNLLLGDVWGFVFQATGGADANGVVQEGTTYCANRSVSVIDAIGNFVTGFVDAIAQMVNGIAALYNDIKADIVAYAAQALTFVGIPCEGECKMVLDAVLTTAMTSIGLPPSLPNFDQLMDMGADYLAGYVASQTGDFPLVKQGAREIIDQLRTAAKNAQGGGGGLPSWLVDDNGFRPAVMYVDIRRAFTPSGGPADGLKISGDPMPRWQDSIVPLSPEVTEVVVPVSLRPDITGTQRLPTTLGGFPVQWPESLQLRTELGDWFANRYVGRCTTFSFGALRGNVKVDSGFASLAPMTTAGIQDPDPGTSTAFDSLPSSTC